MIVILGCSIINSLFTLWRHYMKSFFGGSVFITFLILALPGSSPWAQTTPAAPTAASTPGASLQSLVDGNNAFGLDLYHHLGQSVTKDKNLVFSPYSVSTALAMTWSGAQNNTKTQMAQVLHLTDDPKTIGENFHQLRNGLEAAAKDGGFDLSIANSLWIQNDYHFLQPFLDGLNNDFNAPPNLVDFKTDSEAVGLQINQWVENKTQQKIKDLIPPHSLNPRETKMVLVNAVYFKADWLRAFKAENTKQKPFYFPRGDASVSMMQQEENFKFLETDEAQILELPYKGNRISMLVILPSEWAISAFEQKLTPDLINGWISQMKPQSVDVQLPKFKFTYGAVNLSTFLIDMGMTGAFDKDAADFSGMTSLKEERLNIDQVMHKAFVNVDEKGTEAAAATGVVMVHMEAIMRPPKPVIFNANHPFLFLIRDNQTNSILFIGRIADPRMEN